MNSREADLVVVGAGLAGLIAANRAAAAGHRVIVLENGADERYACNTRIATGVLNMAHTDPYLDPAVLLEAIDADTERYADPSLAGALANVAGPAMDWLRAEGARVIKVPIHGRPVWMLAPPRRPAIGNDWEGFGPDLLLRALAQNLRRRGSEMVLGVRARRLCLEAGRCVGVEGEQGSVITRYGARNVILADGGFQGNAELVKRFISPRPECLVQRSAGTGRGDALLMAEAAGAQLSEANCFYGHLLSQDALTNSRLWPYPTMDTLAAGCIIVERTGRRFVDEGLGGVAISNVLARLSDPLCASAIFDSRIWESSGRTERVAPNPHLLDGGGTLLSAMNVESLAAMLDIPAGKLRQSVETYNQAIANGTGSALDPPRSSGRAFGVSRGSSQRVVLSPVTTPPFHAIRLCAGISYTMGGIAIDARARVLAGNGAVVAGLLAAGSCTGGIEGGPMAGYIGGLLKATCLALIAADTAIAPQ